MLERSKCMNVPEIRFKEFCDYYSDVLLEKCLSVSNKKNNKLEYKKEDALSVSDEFGVVNQIEHLGRSYTGNNISTYKILNKGQIVYTKSPLKLKPFGIIKVNNNKPGLVSVLYAIYDVKEGFEPNYISVYFEPNFRLNRYLLPLINKGAKNTINISDETALSGEVHIPLSYAEQQKIASYFQSLDSLIQTTSKELTSLKQIKAASLQSMFPQEGETVPKVRFKGFEEEWKKEKLGNLFKERIENNINGELLSVTINNGIIKASDNGRFDNSNNDKSHYKVVKIGDIVYNTMRMWQGSSGYSAYEGIVSPAYTVIIPQEQVFPLFFAYLFKTQSLINRFRIHSQGLTTDTWNLKFAGFSIIEVCFPKSKLEQQKIASYFCNLDKQISLQTQHLEKLKQIKAACLDKMFV